ncbi:MAG: polysaccharide biosynthesis protein [Clostridia bacterium]|nr:polysaccharide biosynthesis protein [Clostridia bacterium]
MVYDLVAVNGAYFFALWIRFDCRYSMIPEKYLSSWIEFAPFYTVACFVLFWFLRLYHSLWEFASYSELTRVILSSVVTGTFHIVAITIFVRRMPISYYVIGAGVQFFLVLTVRFAYRFINLERGKRARQAPGSTASRVMLIGAGSAGQMILRDLHKARETNERVCCIIDDDANKQGRYIDGVPIVGGRESILANVEKYKIQKIFLAIPSATAAQRGEILNICKTTACELKNLPGVYQMVNGNVTVDAMKDVDVEDLLGREPIRVSMDEIFGLLNDKVILVTGGGGSIGSELCRQIAKNHPKQLIVLDIYENNAHAIQLELRDQYPDLNLEVLIGSVRDSKRVNQIFDKYRPDIVYHAAAHKHVPLMEDSPCESIKNNAVGTYNTAFAAMTHGCKRFVLISTDKAVNPTNIMGASKRICEMVVQTFARKIREGRAHELRPLDAPESFVCDPNRLADTDFVAVRFGNVLGSNGSVIPRFKEQIARGGPVTVTHPDIIRYFMTIPEAVSLVLQAGAYAEGGEIFVLDMGSPVKIDTLARDLIRLSGLRPDEDIKITYIGLRPGEKLYEEKLMSEEGLRTTPNHLIHIGSPIPFDTEAFLALFFNLIQAARSDRDSDIRAMVADIVPTYQAEDASVLA